MVARLNLEPTTITKIEIALFVQSDDIPVLVLNVVSSYHPLIAFRDRKLSLISFIFSGSSCQLVYLYKVFLAFYRYCECFASGEFCLNCSCTNCYNNLQNETPRQKSIKECLDRNPDAFKPKVHIFKCFNFISDETKIKNSTDFLDQAYSHLGGGLQNTEVAYLLLTQQPWVRYSVFPRIFLLMLLRFIDSTALNIGQILEYVNWTHLALASGKLILQNKTYWTNFLCSITLCYFEPINLFNGIPSSSCKHQVFTSSRGSIEPSSSTDAANSKIRACCR